MERNIKCVTLLKWGGFCSLADLLSVGVDFKHSIIDTLSSADRIVLFGAGSGGSKVYDFLAENVENGIGRILCFADNNPMKWGTKMRGIDVLKPSNAFAIYQDALIVISCGEGDEIIKQLNDRFGISEDRIYIPDIGVLGKNDKEYITGHIELLSLVYDRLCDEKSKAVFKSILEYKLTHDMSLISDIADDFRNQYFDDELIHFGNNDVFLDCGGYIGDTIESYISHNKGVYKKIITFEPDGDNADVIRKNYENQNVSVQEIACWSKKQELYFDKIGSGSGKIKYASSANVSDKIVVKADSIDDICDDENVTFIKMDIEGAEYNALVGAMDTIHRCKPTLKISAYHKQDDFLTLPFLIMSLNPDYKLYMRHYRKLSVQETVLYAL